MEKSNDLIGNRTRDFPACIMVPQLTTLPRAPGGYGGNGFKEGEFAFPPFGDTGRHMLTDETQQDRRDFSYSGNDANRTGRYRVSV
jgi:hypothetical protein